MRKFYLAPASWDRSGHRYVVDMTDVINTVDNTDWYDGESALSDAISDCDYLGEFANKEEAGNYAKKEE